MKLVIEDEAGTRSTVPFAAEAIEVGRAPEATFRLGDRNVSRRHARFVLQSGSVFVEGRDITTVVCPDAAVRVLLVADPERRMARRGAELAGALDETALHDQVVRRDKDDSTLVNFTDAAPGVTVIDSTELTVDEVVDAILALARTNGLTPGD